MSNRIESETTPAYLPEPATSQYAQIRKDYKDSTILVAAGLIMKERLKEKGDAMTSPELVKEYLKTTHADDRSEVFSVMFLDTRHRIIEHRRMFFGTIDGATVHPREVVRAALEVNAAAVIFAHNHPSGHEAPSSADERITFRLKDALALIDVRVLDHMVVGDEYVYSFAENGRL